MCEPLQDCGRAPALSTLQLSLWERLRSVARHCSLRAACRNPRGPNRLAHRDDQERWPARNTAGLCVVVPAAVYQVPAGREDMHHKPAALPCCEEPTDRVLRDLRMLESAELSRALPCSGH